MKIELKNLSKSFDFDIFKNLDFTFQNNNTYSILGLNGTGKTTLVNMIVGLDDDYQGSITIQDCKQDDIFFIPADNVLPGYLTGREYITYIHKLKGKSLNKQKMEDLVDIFGINDFIDNNLDAYSFGMIKKIQFICCCLIEPKIVIMDEVTSGMDLETVKLVEIMINKMNSLNIVISHNLDFINNISDVNLFIQNNTLEVIDKAKIYERLFEDKEFKKKVERLDNYN